MESNRKRAYFVSDFGESCLIKDVELMEEGSNWYCSLLAMVFDCGEYESLKLDDADRF